MMPRDDQPVGPPRLSLVALFLIFLRFGALAFGGPVAQIAMVRQALVEEQRWISRERFNRLLAVMQVMPGPEAHELCVHMGMIARGRLGGIAAGLGFMLPGFLLMLALGWAYSRFIEGQPGLTGVLLGVQIAVLAVIARSVQRIGQHIVIGPTLAAIAVIAFIATVAGVPFGALLIAGALAYARPLPWLATAAIVLTIALIGWLSLRTTGEMQPIPAEVDKVGADSVALFLAGLKGGLLTFGGAYTAIPYVRDDTVGRGWLTDGKFLDGVALANLLPAPLVIFATFAGYIAGGFDGALAITAGMFLPAFAFSLLLFERLETVINHPRLHRVLDGVAAAAAGIIAATVIELAISAAERLDQPLLAAPIFAVAAWAAWRLKGLWVTPLILPGGALAGAMLLR